MRVGIDTFTLREFELNPFQQLDYIKERDFEGAQFGGLRSLSAELDPGVGGDLLQHNRRVPRHHTERLAPAQVFWGAPHT